MGRGHDRGRAGEAAALRFFESGGWRVLDRNWRAGRAEIDLVVERDGVVAFVEVKTRSGPGCGDPLEAITPAKRREIERVAGAWIGARGGAVGAWRLCRFDAVAVQLSPGRAPALRHVPDAWRAGDGG
jgi:putative endonuclease